MIIELGPSQHGTQWRSTLTGARYTWDEELGWLVSFHASPSYHPVRPGVISHQVYGQASEYFEELPVTSGEPLPALPPG